MSNLLSVTLCVALSMAPGPGRRPRGSRARRGICPTYYFLLGRYLEGEGKIDEAAAALKKAIELDPSSAEPRAELAGIYARADRAREALDAAEDALKVDAKNVEANRVLGSVLAAFAEQKKAARPGDAVADYAPRAMRALEIARGDGNGELSIDLMLARLYLDAERPADAIPLLRRIVSEQPQYVDGSVLLAEAQEAAGSADAAIETLTSVLAEQPQFFRGRVQLAELYDREEKWNEAAEQWAAVQRLNPRNTEVATRRATSLLNGRRPGDARDVLREALKIAPNDVRLTFMLAQAQRDAGDLEAAEATARALQTANPNDLRAKFLLGQMLEARGKQAEALTLYKDAATAAPDNPTVVYQYGAALDKAGKQADAQKVFRDLIAKDPLDATALNYLGYMMAEHGTSLDEAVSFIQRALKVEPDNPSYQDSLGWAYFQQGKLDLADQPAIRGRGQAPDRFGDPGTPR